MTVPNSLMTQLARARPPDPESNEADHAAVRVLARLAIIDTGMRVTPARRWHRRVAAIAAGLVALVLLGTPAPEPQVSTPAGVPLATHADPRAKTATPAVEDPLRSLARLALGGDRLARSRLRNTGPRGRRVLLRIAAAGGRTSAPALAMMRSFGAARGRAEAAQVAKLARQPALRADAVWLLASDVGTHGTRHLGALLKAEPAAEREVVAALLQVAARGRRRAAATGLLAGARVGRVHAAAAVLSIRGAAGLSGLLDAVPQETLAAPVMLRVVRDGPRTLRTRLGFLAERGDVRAMTLAAHARLPGVVAVLEAVAQGDDRPGAVRAVEHLARVASVDAHVALGRALEGPAHHAASEALRAVSGPGLRALAAAARTGQRHTAAALAALGAGGPEGLRLLAALAVHPRLALAVTRALGNAGGGTGMEAVASRLLVGLPNRPLTRLGVVAALAHRLRAGDESAGSGLLNLARARMQRPALRALSECGSAGIRWLREAEHEPELARAAGIWLTRIGAKSKVRPAVRGRGFARVGTRSSGSHV